MKITYRYPDGAELTFDADATPIPDDTDAPEPAEAVPFTLRERLASVLYRAFHDSVNGFDVWEREAGAALAFIAEFCDELPGETARGIAARLREAAES